MHRTFFLAFVLVVGPIAATAITITPTPGTNVVNNPGKGWVTYGKKPPEGDIVPRAPIRQVMYRDIEPEEGHSLGADRRCHRVHGLARQFCLGVVCEHPFPKGSPVTPEYLQSAAKYNRSTHLSGPPPAPQAERSRPSSTHLFRTGKIAAPRALHGNPAIASWMSAHGNGARPCTPSVPDAPSDAQTQPRCTGPLGKTPSSSWGSRKFDPIYDDAVAKGKPALHGSAATATVRKRSCLGRTLAVSNSFRDA